MNGININHLRVIKHFSQSFQSLRRRKISATICIDSTARKIIKELVDAEIVRDPSTKDKKLNI